jgi:hypothetical protein
MLLDFFVCIVFLTNLKPDEGTIHLENALGYFNPEW